MAQNSYSTSYNDVPYVSFPYPQTHPDRLSAIARLFSLETPAVETARVLELGCASGNNLIPMASLLPKAEFLGIDYSSKQIEEANAELANLGLKNLSFRCESILDFKTDGKKFDFILVHGVYSWVSKECQDKILEICNKCLTPHGIAYISYNVLPGWRMRGMVRDMMLYHVSKFPDRESKIQQARALLDFLTKSVKGDKNPYGIFLQSELELLSAQNDSYFYHEFLEDNNFPMYFHEFVGNCTSHNLAYLGDSDLRTMSTKDMPEQAQKHLSQTISLVETEQYLDFIRNRMFRMSLVIHAGRQPLYAINPKCVRDLHLGSSLRANDPAMNLLTLDAAQFTCQSGLNMSVSEPILKASLLVLQQAWPASRPCMEVLAEASKKIGLALPSEGPALDNLIFQLGQMLVTAYTSLPIGSVEITTRAVRSISLTGSKPRVHAFAKHQAKTLGAVTNIRHHIMRIGDFEKNILPYLDGQHDLPSILGELCSMVRSQAIGIQENGTTVSMERAEELLKTRLEQTLELFAQRGVLAG